MRKANNPIKHGPRREKVGVKLKMFNHTNKEMLSKITMKYSAKHLED